MKIAEASISFSPCGPEKCPLSRTHINSGILRTRVIVM
jgi:hypothetical protein